MHRLSALLASTVLIVAACGGDSTGPLSTDPPWGLADFDHPVTEAEVIALMAALPDEIDGRSRSGGSQIGVMYGDSGVRLVVSALPAAEIPTLSATATTPTDMVIEYASGGGLGTIEISALDPGEDLVWAATSLQGDRAAGVDTEGTAYLMTWAESDGSWVFHIQADSAEVRTQLIHTFITAGSG
jgi:hypothetical protein